MTKRKKTLTVEEVIFNALENGCTRKAAAALAGIAENTFGNWMRDNPEFLGQVEQAEAAYLAKVGAVVMKHPASAVKWAMMLGRKDPQLQPLTEKVEQTGNQTITFVVTRPGEPDGNTNPPSSPPP